MAITKKQVCEYLADKSNISFKQAESSYNHLLDLIADELDHTGKFELNGIGSLNVISVAERVGRNPSTNERMIIPARKKVKFIVSSLLKARIKGK